MVITQKFLSSLKKVSTQFKWILLGGTHIRTRISHEEFRKRGGEVKIYTSYRETCACPFMAINAAENNVLPLGLMPQLICLGWRFGKNYDRFFWQQTEVKDMM
jgi:hypothetical protein